MVFFLPFLAKSRKNVAFGRRFKGHLSPFMIFKLFNKSLSLCNKLVTGHSLENIEKSSNQLYSVNRIIAQHFSLKRSFPKFSAGCGSQVAGFSIYWTSKTTRVALAQ